MESTYNRILTSDPNVENILNEKEEYNTDLEEKKSILLSNEHKYSLVFPTNINFKTENDVSILLQNFLQDIYRIPSFNNMIMLENISTETDESFRIILSKIPFEIITAEYKNFFDFVIEKNSDYENEFIYKNIAGFYINVDIKSIDSTEILTLYQYITPFIVNSNQEIEIIKKNDFLKYNVFYVIEKTLNPVKFQMIFLQGKKISTEENFIESLIKKFKLKYTKDEILERIENNNILVKNHSREKNLDSFFSVFNYDDKKNKNKYLCKINFHLYITIDFDKQKNLMKNIFNKGLDMLTKTIIDTIFEFNNNTLPLFKANLINEDVNMENIKIKKNYNQLYNYYEINTKYNSIFRYICIKHNIDFGSDLLCIKKNIEFNDKDCIEEISKFKHFINNIIDKAFTNNYQKFYEDKKKLLNE